MKKFLIILFIIVGVVALLPIIGNSVAQKALKENVDLFCANGVEIQNETSYSTYLKTKNHYEFILRDAPKFVKFINQYSDAQLPPYVEAAIGGVTIGVDIEYSNFPISSKIVLDIYPITLPKELEQELKQQSLNFYNYVDKLLQAKGVLYHMNYYTSEDIFDGFIKDIDEKYVFDNGNEMIFKLLHATYYGEGPIIAPKNLHTNIAEIAINVIEKESDETIIFRAKDLKSASTFESQSTYASSASLKSFSFLLKEQQKKKLGASLDDFKVNISSNVQASAGEFYTKMSLKEMEINTKDIHSIKVSDINYDISLDGVDKDSFEEFRVLTSHANVTNSPDYEQKLQKIVVKLLSKGLSLSIPDMSIKKVLLDNKESIDGFNFMARMTLNENPNLEQDLKMSPNKILESINLASTLSLSKVLFTFINENVLLMGLISPFAKEEEDKMIFKIKLNAGALSINDRVIN
ncbi:hypothetical protein M947_05995 [Sulfurimonas hongkongensis]|uniref:DUF945 domain-containing protein n=1 Tax=Sulfurimonas hongkongensis TaxID=1172190 RepID=T0JN14_9BACT|nr:DUF945 family protein [Sulfurimonas hongkongensis]EQB39541.1 hypothetical protein M947_05995 [Sulfurimonas hongkongensis]